MQICGAICELRFAYCELRHFSRNAFMVLYVGFFFLPPFRFRMITWEPFTRSTWNLKHLFIMSQRWSLLFGVVARWPVQPVGPHLEIWFPDDCRRSIACIHLNFCKMIECCLRMIPIVLKDCRVNRLWSRRRKPVDRFWILVSQKPCVVERNGAYFRTWCTRQTCLGGIFGQKDPWCPLVPNFFFADSSLPVSQYLGNRASYSETELKTNHVHRVSLVKKTPGAPWWQNFFLLTHHFLFRSISETVRRRAKQTSILDSAH